MEKMKAYVRTNSQNQTVELAEMPVPEIDKNEVLVRVQAFGVGIHDRYFIPNDANFPYIIGSEAAGIITMTGDKISCFKTGDRVILTSVLQPKGGCWAEYVAALEDSLTPLPNKMDFTEGAAIPVAGKTAIESMRALDLTKGDTLFVAGASGAIGTLIIQMAAQKGIRVIASASAKNHEYMTSLGAEIAVDYSVPNWKAQVKEWMPNGVDAALAIQPGTVKDCVDLVRDGGKAVTVSGDPIKTERDVAVFQFEYHEDSQDLLNNFVSDIAEGKIRLVIEHIYPFAQAIDALEKTETRHAKGKLVVSLNC